MSNPSLERKATHKNLLMQLAWVISDIGVLTKRNLLRYVRLPQLLIFSTLQPVLFVLLLAFVFGGAIDTSGVNYVNYLIPGILVQTVLIGASQTTVGLAEDLSKGVIDRFRSLPMARSAVLAGRTLADSTRNLFVVLLVVGVGTLIGFRFQGGLLAAIGAVLLVVLFGYAFSWISAYIGLLVKDPEAASVAGNVWVFPLIFASSVFVPTETMPDWLQTFANVQPISLTADAVRYLTSGGLAPGVDPAAVWQTIGWMLGILLVFVPLAVRQYRRNA
ncbi:MAG: ABC transporter permease [Deinococcota bacterium]